MFDEPKKFGKQIILGCETSLKKRHLDAQAISLEELNYKSNYIHRLGISGGTVLYAGPDQHSWSLALDQFFKNVIALDKVQNSIESIDSIAKLGNYSPNIVMGNLESLPFGDETFDAVFCKDIISYTDYRKSIVELVRVLKPGGYLYTSFNDSAWADATLSGGEVLSSINLAKVYEASLNQMADLMQNGHHRPLGQIRVREILVFLAVLIGALGVCSSSARPLLSQIRVLWKFKKPIWIIASKFNNLVNSITMNIKNLERYKNEFKVINQISRRIFSYKNIEFHKKLINDLCIFLKGGDLFQSKRENFCINKEDIVGLFKFCEVDVIGASPEGTLIINTESPFLNSGRHLNSGVMEILGCKKLKNKLPSHEFFKKNAKNAAYRFSNIIHNSTLSNVSHNYGLESEIARFYMECTRGFDKQLIIHRLVDAITGALSTPEEKIFAIYSFVQDAIFHHPLIQLGGDLSNGLAGSLSTLFSGVGRCGNVAYLTCDLYKAAGYKARVSTLYRHICCEIFYKNAWRLVDPDSFKGGIFLKNKEGDLPTIDQLREDAVLIDCLPAIGLQLSPDALWSRGLDGGLVQGYTEIGNAWDRPYTSYIFLGGEFKKPPKPPLLKFEFIDKKLMVNANLIDQNIQLVKVAIGKKSRGWRYTDFPNQQYLNTPDSGIALLESTPEDLLRGVTMVIPEKVYALYVNIYALDSYQLENKLWVWPSEEIIIPIN